MTNRPKTVKEAYADDLANSQLWLMTAVQLYWAIETLDYKLKPKWQDYVNSFMKNRKPSEGSLNIANYQMVQLMLAGFCLENMLKYEYIRRNRESIRANALAGKGFPAEIDTHILTKLADLIGFTLTDERRQFLEKLSSHSSWTGRYPVPINTSQFSKSISHLIWSQGDMTNFRELIEELCRFLNLDYESLRRPA